MPCHHPVMTAANQSGPQQLVVTSAADDPTDGRKDGRREIELFPLGDITIASYCLTH